MWLPFDFRISRSGMFFLTVQSFTASLFWECCKLSVYLPKQGKRIAACSTHSSMCWSTAREENWVNSVPRCYASNHYLTCKTGVRHGSFLIYAGFQWSFTLSIEFKILLIAFKSLKGLEPTYVDSLISIKIIKFMVWSKKLLWESPS